MQRIHEKTTVYTAEAAITKFQIVKFGTAENTVIPAAAASDALIGVCAELDADIGEPVDVFRCGLVPVVYGGTVTKGSVLTSDANGAAVAASAGNRAIGIAEESGVSGDIGSVWLSPSIA